MPLVMIDVSAFATFAGNTATGNPTIAISDGTVPLNSWVGHPITCTLAGILASGTTVTIINTNPPSGPGFVSVSPAPTGTFSRAPFIIF